MTSMFLTVLATQVLGRTPYRQQEFEALAEMELQELMDQRVEEMEAESEQPEVPLAIYHDVFPAKILEFDDTDGVEIFHEGAHTIQVHLRQEGLANCPGVDLVVESGDGEDRHSYDGEDFHEAGCEDDECFRLTAMSLSTDTVRVFWEGPAEECEDLRVMVDGYTADNEELRRRQMEESQCGNKYDWMDRECAKNKHPNEYAASKPVGLLWPIGCTVWKLKGNFLLTNAHCCPEYQLGAGMFYDETTGDSKDKRWTTCRHVKTEIWFDYEKNGCNASGRKRHTAVKVDQTLYFMRSRTSGADFALLTTKDNKLASKFGYVEFDPTPPKIGDVMWIAGQPRAQEKKLSLYDTGIDGKRRVCKVTKTEREIFQYNCDTTGGNSGSPVLRADGKRTPTAFGVHQAAGCAKWSNNHNSGNTGTKASYFMKILKPYFGLKGGNPWGGKYIKVKGAKCPTGYEHITSDWQDCRVAGIMLGLRGDSVAHVAYKFPWGTGRPKGCFQSTGNNRVHFNTGQGGRFQGNDRVICKKSQNYAYTRKLKGCVNGQNIKRYPNKSVDECKAICDADSNCKAFEYGVNYGGGSGNYKYRDCQPQRSANHANCDGGRWNLDLYIKENPTCWSAAHKSKYLGGCVSGDNCKAYRTQSAAKAACIAAGSKCGGILTGGHGHWQIRKGRTPIGNTHETCYVKQPCVERSSERSEILLQDSSESVSNEDQDDEDDEELIDILFKAMGVKLG